MTVDVACPNCGKSYHVGDESLGARAKCKTCGATFTLSVSMDDTGKSKSGEAPAGGAPPKDAAVRSAYGKSFAGKGQDQAGEHEPMPKKLGHYVIQRKLGAGAMGVVYLARDPVLDRQVAIKVLPAELSRDEERLKRFLREAKSAARLHHTNVAAVHQAGAEGRLAYIAMEYVEGTSLDKAVSEAKPLQWREATRVIRDAAAGLGAAHAIGLVHRDIKPANLIRTKDGVTKVVDFGLARGQHTNTQLTQQGTLLGTPAYMAPEQWTGGEIDGRSDLYSLTCTYYFLLTGRLAFDAPSLPALGYQHRYEAFPDPRKHVPNLPDGICRILTRGSAKEPSQRYQTAEELVAELEVLLACPDESLTFGSSWAQFAAPAGAELPPPDDPLGEGLAALQTPALPAAQPASARTTRSKLDVPLWVWIAAGGAVAVLLLLGVLIVFSTKYGTVQIAVRGTEAQDVHVTLDGETIAIEGLDEPLKLKVGEHQLTASSPSFETVTRSFQIKKNETTVVEVTFVPKVASAAKAKAPPEASKPAAAPGPMRFPATYRVQIEPPESILAVSSGSANISGAGRDRTITVPDPDTKTKLMLVATLDGYRTLTQELQPVGGETKDLILRLERIPELPTTVAPTTSVPPLAVAPFDEAEAKRHQAAWAAYLNVPVEITNSIGMKLTLIPPGEFMMGAELSAEEVDRRFPGGKLEFYEGENPRHRVRITRPFYLAVHEATVKDFRLFVTASGHRTTAEREGSAIGQNIVAVEGLSWREPGFQQGDTHPVVCVSWHDATAFCQWLSREEKQSYRLPTEAEWEFTCRAGTDTLFFWGDNADAGEKYLNGADLGYAQNSRISLQIFNFHDGYASTALVGHFKPNGLGLYDMLGNVWEWCGDHYDSSYYAISPLEDPTGPMSRSERVCRGGGWWSKPPNCRSAERNNLSPDDRVASIGFRVAMTLPAPEPAAGAVAEAGLAVPANGIISIGPRRYKVSETRVSDSPTDDYYPSVAKSKDGRFVVAWERRKDGDQDCWARVFSATGRSVGSEFRITPSSPSDGMWAPAVAAVDEEGVVAVWGNAPRGIQCVRLDTQFRAIGTPLLVDSRHTTPAVSVSSLGGFAVAWGKVGWGIGFRMFDARGDPIGDAVLVDARPVTIPEQSHPAPVIAHAPNGDFVVAWHTGDGDTCIRRYSPSGTALGPVVTVVHAFVHSFPIIAFTTANELIVGWLERIADGSIALRACRYEADSFLASQPWTICADVRVIAGATIAVAPSGEYLVAWTMDRGQGEDVYGRLYDSADVPLGPIFRVSDTGQPGKALPVQGGRRSAAFVGDGFLVSWFYRSGGAYLTCMSRVK